MDRDPDLYLNYWPWYSKIIYSLFSFVCAIFYSSLISMILTNFEIQLNPLINNSLEYLILIIVVGVTVFRNIVIKNIFRYSPEKLYKFSHNSIKYYWIALIMMFFFFIYSSFFDLDQNQLLTYLGMILFYSHLTILFGDSYSEKGSLRFEFDNLISNIDVVSKRNHWLKIISKTVEKELENNYIGLSKEEFVYNFIMNFERDKSKDALLSLKENMLKDDGEIIPILKQIVPRDRITVLKKQTLRDEIIQIIRNDPKLVINSIIILLLVLANPKEWINLFKEFFLT